MMFAPTTIQRSLHVPAAHSRLLSTSPALSALLPKKAKTTPKPLLKKSVAAPKTLKLTKADLPPPGHISGWTLYVREHSGKGVKTAQLIKDLAPAFKALPDEDRQVYLDKAKEITVERKLARQEWLDNVDPAVIRALNKRKGKATIRLKHKSDHIKRPLTSFFLYGQDVRKSGDVDGMAITEQMKVIAEKWRALSEEEKQPYVDANLVAREEYKATKAGTVAKADE